MTPLVISPCRVTGDSWSLVAGSISVIDGVSSYVQLELGGVIGDSSAASLESVVGDSL